MCSKITIRTGSARTLFHVAEVHWAIGDRMEVSGMDYVVYQGGKVSEPDEIGQMKVIGGKVIGRYRTEAHVEEAIAAAVKEAIAAWDAAIVAARAAKANA